MTILNPNTPAYDDVPINAVGTGYAIASAATQHFLDACPAVLQYDNLSDDVFIFDFDNRDEVDVVPPGVFFDRDYAIGEDEKRIAAAITACNAEHYDA